MMPGERFQNDSAAIVPHFQVHSQVDDAVLAAARPRAQPTQGHPNRLGRRTT